MTESVGYAFIWLGGRMPTMNDPSDRRGRRLVTDGGDADEANDDDEEAVRRSNVEVHEAGEAEPAEPAWEAPDLDDIPEFEVRAEEPLNQGGARPDPSDADLGTNPNATPSDPTAGMPHDAQAPGATAVSGGGTEAYVAALELCAKLPDDVALPEEAADLVPAAVEAELEQDIQSFAAAEFDNPSPHVDTIAFEAIDDDIWLRIRIGIPPEGFESLDPETLRSYALQQLDDVL